ncbi:MAG: hypothetical protein ABIK09_18000 [Pseudomonadota bacterium]
MRTVLVLCLLAAAQGCEPDPTEGSSSTCPPVGSFGFAKGELLPALTFEGCDETHVALHDLCGAPALIYHYAGWCPSCLHFLEDLPALMDEAGLAPEQVVVLVSEDPAGGRATLPFCQGLLGEVEIPGIAALDPRGGETSGLVIVTDASARVVLRREDAPSAAILEALSP